MMGKFKTWLNGVLHGNKEPVKRENIKMVCGLKRGTCDCSQQDIDCQYLVPDETINTNK